MIRTFIQITALILTLGATVFLAKSNLGFTPEVIARISSPQWDYNSQIMKSFSAQKADTKVGFILLLAAFTLQMINTLWPMRWEDFDINRYGFYISIGICLIILIAAYGYSKTLSDKIHLKTMQIIKEGQMSYD